MPAPAGRKPPLSAARRRGAERCRDRGQRAIDIHGRRPRVHGRYRRLGGPSRSSSCGAASAGWPDGSPRRQRPGSRQTAVRRRLGLRNPRSRPRGCSPDAVVFVGGIAALGFPADWAVQPLTDGVLPAGPSRNPATCRGPLPMRSSVPVDVCHRHRCLLESRRPVCGRHQPQLPRAVRIQVCSYCGHDLIADGLGSHRCRDRSTMDHPTNGLVDRLWGAAPTARSSWQEITTTCTPAGRRRGRRRITRPGPDGQAEALRTLRNRRVLDHRHPRADARHVPRPRGRPL